MAIKTGDGIYMSATSRMVSHDQSTSNQNAALQLEEKGRQKTFYKFSEKKNITITIQNGEESEN